MLSRLYRPVLASCQKVTHNAVRCASSVQPAKIGEKSEAIFAREDKYGAHNYAPLGVALRKGEGEINKILGHSISFDSYAFEFLHILKDIILHLKHLDKAL